ncbi:MULTISPECIES: MarR family winged helix-turn-helix transcriptional regulator [Pseudofrankia]|uniref:MarR family winged helix-turn-helix transcriptional regulator n=1 Tax=Pseudofrankia TaxID=2994363 RepID=UPI000234BC18|nr:MarR family transcriptional regulator [Pseudofrankia saprophytica]
MIVVDGEEHITWLLKRAFHHWRRTLNDAVSVENVTSEQIGVMRHLSGTPGLSGAELARRNFITPQAAQLSLATLERRGLIERRPDAKGGRSLGAYLTPEGVRVADEAVAHAHQVEEDLLSVFDAAEKEAFREFLIRLTSRARPIAERDGEP